MLEIMMGQKEKRMMLPWVTYFCSGYTSKITQEARRYRSKGERDSEHRGVWDIWGGWWWRSESDGNSWGDYQIGKSMIVKKQ